MYDRYDIINHCRPTGGCSECLKANEPDIQQYCSFYVKATYAEKCTNLRHDEYCGCHFAFDFASGKEVKEENIPNFKRTLRPPTLIDGHMGHYQPGRDRYQSDRDPTLRRIRKLAREGLSDHVKKFIDVPKGENPSAEHFYATMSDELYGVTHDGMVVWPNHCMVGDGEPLPTVDADGFLKFINMEIEDAFAVPEPLLMSNPCKEVSIAVDNSGCMTPERFLELSAMVAETLRDQTLCTFKPVTKSVTQEYLSEAHDAFCAAYSEKYGLFLDMTDPNLYTIYNSMGKFMSLRTLLDDKITPFDLDFRMKGGSDCFEEYGFEEFVEQIEQMLVQGR